jgi:hypothetical protein
MALRDTLTADQDESPVIGFCLLPPEFLVAIHLRSGLRTLVTNCREG